MSEETRLRLLELTSDLVSAYVANNSVPIGELASLIGRMHETLQAMATNTAPEKPKEPQQPAVPIRRSVTPDYIISLEDGQKFKSLKRHLAARHGMTPEEYRAKWGLPSDYPMVAPNYTAKRSELAKTLGLGRKPEPPPPPPAKRTRKNDTKPSDELTGE